MKTPSDYYVFQSMSRMHEHQNLSLHGIHDRPTIPMSRLSEHFADHS